MSYQYQLMNRKTNTALIALLGTILMALSTWGTNNFNRITNNSGNDATRVDVFRQSFW